MVVLVNRFGVVCNRRSASRDAETAERPQRPGVSRAGHRRNIAGATARWAAARQQSRLHQRAREGGVGAVGVDRLRVPPGFRVSVFASGLGTARMLAVGDDGTLYLTRRDSGDVLALKGGWNG